jgi:MerR family copper efflux transcriptional regulator
MTTNETMTRGVFAKRAGIGAETVRYYERIGLLEEPARTASGYRVYARGDLARLRFIRRAKELGFSLDDIRELIALRLDDGADCSNVEARAAERLADVRERIRDLGRVRRGLESLIASCRANPVKESCPILEVLEGKTR